MERVIIGIDPHKLSATIEVVDQHEQLLGSGRFTTDKAGYALSQAMSTFTAHRPHDVARPLRPCRVRCMWRTRPGQA